MLLSPYTIIVIVLEFFLHLLCHQFDPRFLLSSCFLIRRGRHGSKREIKEDVGILDMDLSIRSGNGSQWKKECTIYSVHLGLDDVGLNQSNRGQLEVALRMSIAKKRMLTRSK